HTTLPRFVVRDNAALTASPSLSVAFFSDSYCDHRDLHSFPTRRSSDLGVGDEDVSGQRHGGRTVGADVVHDISADGASTVPLARSEEHTSELQSRENLVCRLLLEKKKNH